MIYINPYVLLNVSPNSLSEVDGRNIAREKRKVLHEIDLSDNSSITVEGVELSKADCHRIIDDLDNASKKEFHLFIFQNKPLKDFLTKGRLDFFKNYRIESIYKLSEFIDFISPYFSYQYDKLLLKCFNENDIDDIKLLLSISPIVNEEHYELCFKSTYSTIKQIDNELIQIAKDIDNKVSPHIENGFKDLPDLIENGINIEILNVLPSYFGTLRNQLAQNIRNIARDLNNDPYNNYLQAFPIVQIAYDLKTDGLVKQTITKGYFTIKKNYDDTFVSKPAIAPIQNVTAVSSSITAEDDKQQEEEKGKSGNKFYVGFLLMLSGLFTWALFNATTQRVILYLAAGMYAILLYNLVKAKDKSSNARTVIYGLSCLVCISAFFVPILAVLFISYLLLGFIHSAYTVSMFKKNPDSKWGFGYLTVAIGIAFSFYPSEKSGIDFTNVNSSVAIQQTHNGTDSQENKVSSVHLVANAASANSNIPPIHYPTPEKHENVFIPVSMKNGNFPPCSNVTPKFDYTLNNKLVIAVSLSDAAVKIINSKTNKCIRFVYISNGTTYTIKNIPEGLYYLKIAYGDGWSVKKGDPACNGHFTSNGLYKRGEKTLDYYLVKTRDGYQVPSYSLSLKTTFVNSSSEKFDTNSISEKDFSKD